MDTQTHSSAAKSSQKRLKICFSFQRNFTRIQHAIALELMKRGIADQFCGFMTSVKSEQILLEQKDIEYGTLISDDELHEEAKRTKLDLHYIQELEKEIGLPTLWPYLVTDRCIFRNIPHENFSYTPKYDHEGMLRLLQVESKAMRAMLDKEKPDLLILPLTGSMGVQLLYEMAKKRGVKTLFVLAARIDDRITICDNNMNDFSNVVKNVHPTKEDYENADAFIQRFNGQEEVRYDGIHAPKKVQFPLKFVWDEFAGFIKYVRQYLKTQRYIRRHKLAQDYTLPSPRDYVRNRVKRFGRRLKGYKNLYSKPDWNEDFAYFPLHVEPEVAVSVWAPFYDNQIELARSIAKSLPAHFKLYVKDKPNMLYDRPASYYEKLLRIPNVKLLDPHTGSQKISKHAKLITTITGTAGFEAYLMGKPVITFGSVMYNAAPSVKKAGKVTDLPALVKDALENYKFDKEEAQHFVASLYHVSQPFAFGKLWHEANMDEVKNSPDISMLTDMLLKAADRF